tara:strand:+ start:207 stop:353 length:147 start_codon:yes stop_codon:yes gene_type:complete
MVKNYSKTKKNHKKKGPRELVIKRILAFSKSYKVNMQKKEKSNDSIEI